jgi:3-hydroxyacyl-CoA dehydrogenase
MHFFSPANVMKLLEVVRGAKTAKDVLATVDAARQEDQKDLPWSRASATASSATA